MQNRSVASSRSQGNDRRLRSTFQNRLPGHFGRHDRGGVCVFIFRSEVPSRYPSITDLSFPMTYDEFVDAVQDRLQLDDPDNASRRMTVVLETFSEILYRTERDTLGAPLPKPLAHLLQSARPENTRKEVERLNAEAFLSRVQARADLSRSEAQATVSAVLSVLELAVGAEPLSDVGDHLPPSYGDLFPFVPSP